MQNLQAAGEPKREAQVPRWLNEVENAIGRLEKTINDLSERISSVTLMEPPIPAGTAIKEIPPETLVPVAEHLRRFTQQIDNLNADLMRQRNRIEL